MSPRKFRLDSALDDLRYLPRVLKALEVLNGEQEKVRALMGHGRREPQLQGAYAHPPPPIGATISSRAAGYGAATIVEPTGTLAPSNPILDTPERREYEAAKKAGSVVPDPFAGISPAQRERMEEQKALVERLRAQRPTGLARVPLAHETPGADKFDQVVVTEELEQSASGSAGAEVQSGGFTDDG